MTLILCALALAAGILAVMAMRRRPPGFCNDFVRALDDDPAREAAADAAGLDLEGNPQIVSGAGILPASRLAGGTPAPLPPPEPRPFRVYVEVVGLPVATVERRLRGARALVAQGVAEGEQQPPHWRCWQDCGGCVRKVPDKGLTP
ncbi:MAG TPA: hypothetical protein P5118_23305 [Planctomycetota bacterium]|nr:hypothetical protein [Planctomycetota bacterium]